VLQNDSTEPDGFGVMNYGTLNVNLGGSLVNNSGVFNLNGANLNIAGIVTNNLYLENQGGQITVQSGGILDNSNSTFGILNNGGTVTLQSGAQMSLGANAGFYNVASSVLNVARAVVDVSLVIANHHRAGYRAGNNYVCRRCG
ncbi:MAG: hypothetical protein ACKPI8_21380, partial [Microcystis panniformis]